MSHSAATMEPPCESPAAATAPPPLAARPGSNPTSLIAPFFEPRPGRGLMPGMSFADYTIIPAANASLLKEATPFEQITKLIALHGLPSEAIRFLELTGDSAADAVGMADDLRPVTVPRTFVLPGMAPAAGEKPTPAQTVLIAQVRDTGQAVDAREFNAGTLGRCADKGWVRTEMREVQESALSESVKDSRAKALAIGDAVHKAILEPEFFATDTWHQHWQLSPTKSLVSERALAAQAEDPGRRLITPEIVDTARRCRDAVWKVKKAAWYLTQPGANEVSAEVWDPEMGIWRKCRFDRLPHAADDGILDVKTTRSRLILSQLRNEAIKYAYGLQLGFYLDTLAMLEGSPRSRSHIIWVTNEAPFIARITELNEVLPEISMTQRGRDIYQERLAAFVLSWHEQQWDAYENEDPIPLLTL